MAHYDLLDVLTYALIYYIIPLSPVCTFTPEMSRLSKISPSLPRRRSDDVEKYGFS